MKILILFMFVIIGLPACDLRSRNRKAADEIASRVPETPNMNVGKRNYRLYIPKGWSTEHRSAYGVEFYYLLAPVTPDDPNTNINVTSEYMQNLPLEEFTEKTIESVKKNVPGAANFFKGQIFADTLKASWYSYTMEPEGIKAALVSYIFAKDGIAYTITAGTTLQNASRYRSLFDSVARSMEFNEPVVIKKAPNN